MNMSTLCTIKYMNRSYFSKARYMIGVGFKILGRTPVPKLPPSYPPRVKCSKFIMNVIRLPFKRMYLKIISHRFAYWADPILSLKLCTNAYSPNDREHYILATLLQA